MSSTQANEIRICLDCGEALVRKMAKQGVRAGQYFLGCPNWGRNNVVGECSVAVNLDEEGQPKTRVRMYPPRFPYPNDPLRRAEQRFYKACQEQLDDGWIVLYEQHWYGSRNGKKQSGEADFILLNALYGVFVVEVKGGQTIGVENGEWYTVPHGLTTRQLIKNPFTQAADSKFILWQYIRENLPHVRLNGELGHMVVFPGHRQQSDMSPQARRQLICDKDDMKNLIPTMQRVAQQFQKGNWTDSDLRQLVAKLMPTFKLLGPQSEQYEEFFDQLDELTDRQLTAFSMLRNQQKLNIHGGAGTGKTILALHRSIELSLTGKKVFYLCHSNPLAKYLHSELLRRGIEESNWPEIMSIEMFANQFLEELESCQGDGESFWETVAECCLKLAENEDELIDALIIDEAQSCEREAVEAAMLLLRSDGHLYIFGDNNQSTIRTGSTRRGFMEERQNALQAFGMTQPVELNINCRSSVEIADFSHSIVQTKTDSLGSSFSKVVQVRSQSSDYGKSIADVVRSWREQFGIDFSEIQILYTPTLMKELLLFQEQPTNSELGVSVFDDMVIDWTPNPFFYYSFLNDSNSFSRFMTEVGSLAESMPERMEQFLDWHWDAHSGDEGESSSESELQEPEKERLANSLLEIEERFALRQQEVEQLQLPVLQCLRLEDFIGLESRAVIVVLPAITRNRLLVEHFSDFAADAYIMATRARALLAVVGEPETLQLLESLQRKLKLDL